MQQNSLIALIVEWRRLELRGWSQLLDSEAEAFNDGISEWWFSTV
jgi:midasin